MSQEEVANAVAELLRAHAGDRTAAELRVAVTGLAGTGKSFLIARVAATLRAAGIPVALLCPTRDAAAALAGQMHSAGVETGEPPTTYHSFLGLVVRGAGCVMSWSRTDDQRGIGEAIAACGVLVFDEASMISARDFERLIIPALDEAMVPRGRARAEIGLLFVGDTNQLPPVHAGPADSILARVCTQATTRAAHHFVLTENWRARSDPAYAQRLQRIAMAGTAQPIELQPFYPTGKEDARFWHPGARFVTPSLAVVDRLNAAYLWQHGQRAVPVVNLLVANQCVGRAAALFAGDDNEPPVVWMAPGAPVVLTQTLDGDTGMYNGRRGKVVAACSPVSRAVVGDAPPDADVPRAPGVWVDFPARGAATPACVRFVPVARRSERWLQNGPRMARTTLPLRTAAAGTLHSVQGQTIRGGPVIYVATNRENRAGAEYVAMSRAERMEDVVYVQGLAALSSFLAHARRAAPET